MPQDEKILRDAKIDELKELSNLVKRANKELNKISKNNVQKRSLEEFYKIMFELADKNMDENGGFKYILFPKNTSELKRSSDN